MLVEFSILSTCGFGSCLLSDRDFGFSLLTLGFACLVLWFWVLLVGCQWLWVFLVGFGSCLFSASGIGSCLLNACGFGPCLLALGLA